MTQLARAQSVAEELVALLAGNCSRIEIAGSIRRGKAEVKDIEIVAVPRVVETTQGLFGEPGEPINELLAQLDALRMYRYLEARVDTNGRTCWGPRHQRAVYEGVAVDVFQVLPPADWGVIMTIRTGPADFSKRLVTQRTYGGFMPFGMQVRDGALWQGSVRIPCPEEHHFFAALGLDWIEPGDRA